MPHLLGGAFKHASTAQCEQGITHKGGLIVFKVIGNVAQCVSRHLQYAYPCLAQLDDIAVSNLLIDARNPVRIIGRANNSTAPLGLQCLIPTSMIKVMMGIQNMR